MSSPQAAFRRLRKLPMAIFCANFARRSRDCMGGIHPRAARWADSGEFFGGGWNVLGRRRNAH